MEGVGYKSGDVILTSEPFVYVLDRQHRGKRCEFCFDSNDKLLRCSRCSFAYYCDKGCQRNAWKDHKPECENIKRVKPKEPTDTVLLLSRIINKLKKANCAREEEKVGPYSRCFEDLESHCDDIKRDPKRMEQFTTIYAVMCEFLGRDNVPPKDETFKIFGKMVINTFSICNAEMQAVGAGLYLVPSRLDHSCVPNALPVFEGTTLILRALKDIESKDITSIRISYIDLLDTTQERRCQLEAQYYFQCMCPRCSLKEFDEEMNKIEPGVPNKDVDNVVATVKRALKLLSEMKKSKHDPRGMLELCRKTYKVMDTVLAPSHILRVKVLDQAFEASIEIAQWKEALMYGRQTLEPYRLYYGNVHPSLGIQLFKIGKIELYLQQLQKAEKTLLQAEKVLVITHGEKHRLYQDLLKYVCQCQEELRYSGIG